MVLCECGCGGEIISKPYHKYRGIPKYIRGHNVRGRHHSIESKKKQSESHMGEKNSRFGKHCSLETKKKMSESRIGISYSEQTIRKMSESKKGKHLSPMSEFKKDNHYSPQTEFKKGTPIELHPSWKGGISFFPYCIKFNRSLKEKIRERDNYQCQNPQCLCTQLESLLGYHKKLSIHHIHYDKENCYPDLITLCISCNSKVNSNRDYWEELFMNILRKRNIISGE